MDRAACSSMQATSDSFRLNQCPLAADLQRQVSSFIEFVRHRALLFMVAVFRLGFPLSLPDRVDFASQLHNHNEDLTTPR
jgi:hypothetical protein